jgi:SAM-dependent methyltransferase
MIRLSKKVIRLILNRIHPPDKYQAELNYWKELYSTSDNNFNNSWYANIMIPMSGEINDEFLRNKIVADFGCGPAGSLLWAKAARERIGIDVLSDKYAKLFDLTKHDIRYVTCSETHINLEDNSVDMLYTLNAMDHTEFFDIISRECLRILKPGGQFFGSFNLNEPVTVNEPQVLTESLIQRHILQYLECTSYRLTEKGLEGGRFNHFFEHDDLPSGIQKECILWVRGNKK